MGSSWPNGVSGGRTQASSSRQRGLRSTSSAMYMSARPAMRTNGCRSSGSCHHSDRDGHVASSPRVFPCQWPTPSRAPPSATHARCPSTSAQRPARGRHPRFLGPAQVPTPLSQPMPRFIAAPTRSHQEAMIMVLDHTPSARVSRRALIGVGLATAAVVPLASLHRAAAGNVPRATSVTAAVQETSANLATWRTWLLASADELRPAAPGAPGQVEIDEVVAAQADPSDETVAAIARWGSGPAIIPWSSMAGEVSAEFKISGMPQNRFMAIYHTALHDAAIAAWDAQVAHARPSPGATSDKITPAAGVDPDRPSFPSEHAAVAGAAAVVLAYLLPDAAPGRFDALAAEAAESRIAAGAAFRSDVEAGLALGTAVGEKAVARAEGDGSDATWDPATRPTGPGTWQPTPPGFVETPFAPLAGAQQTWVMASGDQYRPAPPPEYGSA